MPIVKLTRENLTPIADRMPGKAPRSPKSPKRSPKPNVKNLYPDISQLGDKEVENADAVADEDEGDDINTESEDDNISDIENKDGYSIDSIDEPDFAKRELRPRKNRKVQPLPEQGKAKPKANVNRERIYPHLPEQQQKPARPEGNGILKNLIWLLGIMFISIGCVMVLFKPQSDTVSKTGPQFVDYYKLFKPKFDGLRERYPSQTDRFWKVIGASIRRLLNTEIPTYPAIIMMSIPRGFSKVGTCIAKEISNNLNSFFNQSVSSYIDTLTLDSTSPPKTKLDLDKRLISVLETTKSVVIDHIETLKGSTALLFHGYCDGDNAPYKSSAIIFVLHTGVEVNAMTEYYVEAELTRRWGGHLGVDEMPALLSRIANNIALVSPGEAVDCQL
ncbi:torsin-1A-interacting protein 1-like [Dreissena polymorpha]|uniref:Torsin-1A-interacting protein 1/2 AAA+ activator domain-containing protein n=1 Tax=Dreissena polymorpha TaxID=45954 RepID=A0A9D4F991_DREPO|nr:torsin-1A-interacting protein 1-like [Dreissena polymorpha]KAH3794620.1 hypothetical protein DPMN_148157 [Dreissena polymorpha]